MKITALLFAALPLVAAELEPNAAAQACADASAGDTCIYTHRSTEMQGQCTVPDTSSACGAGYTPDDSCLVCTELDLNEGGSGGGSDSTIKVQPAVSACSTKSEGDSCGFVSADGSKVTGSCIDEGPGACGPDTSSTCYVCSSSGGTDEEVPVDSNTGAQDSNECAGLNIGDDCSIIRGDSTIIGVCEDTAEDVDTGDGVYACVPASDEKVDNKPAETTTAAEEVFNGLTEACENLSENDSCSYVMDGNTIDGVCVTTGERGSRMLRNFPQMYAFM